MIDQVLPELKRMLARGEAVDPMVELWLLRETGLSKNPDSEVLAHYREGGRLPPELEWPENITPEDVELLDECMYRHLALMGYATVMGSKEYQEKAEQVIELAEFYSAMEQVPEWVRSIARNLLEELGLPDKHLASRLLKAYEYSRDSVPPLTLNWEEIQDFGVSLGGVRT